MWQEQALCPQTCNSFSVPGRRSPSLLTFTSRTKRVWGLPAEYISSSSPGVRVNLNILFSTRLTSLRIRPFDAPLPLVDHQIHSRCFDLSELMRLTASHVHPWLKSAINFAVSNFPVQLIRRSSPIYPHIQQTSGPITIQGGHFDGVDWPRLTLSQNWSTCVNSEGRQAEENPQSS